MIDRIVECVPNFSEGRDTNKIKTIVESITSVNGIQLLDVDTGADANRTVVTFIGNPEQVLEAAYQSVKTASQVLDMSQHTGSHPRMGATDVCPFIPVSGTTIEDCTELACKLGARVGEELKIPVYLYEHSAKQPERVNLANIRNGEYEGLAEKLKDDQWKPDFGPACIHQKAGALITGAREFLIAYNITINSKDKTHATDIAFELREKGRIARRMQTNAFYNSGKIIYYNDNHFPCGNCQFDATTMTELEAHCQEAHNYSIKKLLSLNNIDANNNIVGQKVYRAGLFTHCKAIGWYVDEYKRSQLSINLTNYKITSMEMVLEATRQMANERGLIVTGSEIIGLVPFQALLNAGQFYLTRQGKSPFIPTSDLIENAVFSMGLSDVSSFDINKKILGLPKIADNSLTNMTCAHFIDEVSRNTPAPGGGSVAAMAGSLGASLIAMVANLTYEKNTNQNINNNAMLAMAEQSHQLKYKLLSSVDDDTNAFNNYLNAKRLPQNTDEEKNIRISKMQEGLKSAVDIPWSTAKSCFEIIQIAKLAIISGNEASITDAMVGIQTAFAGLHGGIWNVLINLKDIDDKIFIKNMEDSCAKLLTDAKIIVDEALFYGNEKLSTMIKQTK